MFFLFKKKKDVLGVMCIKVGIKVGRLVKN